MTLAKKTLINLLWATTLSVLAFLSVAHTVSAQTCPYDSCLSGCTRIGACIEGSLCEVTTQSGRTILSPTGAACGGGEGTSILGGIQVPRGVATYDTFTGSQIGLLVFINRLLRIFTIIAGAWVMLNMILAGYQFLSSSEAAVFGKVRERITYSIIGIVIIASAYVIAAIIGMIFFGDPTFILQPSLYQPASG